MTDESPTFVNMQVAVERYAVTRRTLYHWIDQHAIATKRAITGRLVNAADIERKLASRGRVFREPSP